MCGIAGVLRFDGPATRDEVERQLDTIAHRGPDSWGIHLDGPAAIGQNRLAVIDLVTGDPPIATPDGRIGVAFNGEIYNYADIRASLLADGHVLRTAGDTEVIAHLSEHGSPVEVARRLDGMFVYAVWDARSQVLVLGRDRFGKKPLHWWQGPSSLVFGSEIKAVLAHPDVTADLDAGAVPAYLRFGYVPSPRTFFRGVQSVPPGCVLVVDTATRSARVERYWSLPAVGERLELSMEDAAHEVRETLRRAVVKRMIADVPLGAFLSGGVDSAVVVAMMAEASTRPVRTFTIGFSDPAFDEREAAAALAAHVGADHTELVVEPAAVDLVHGLVHHFDQPFADSSAIPMWLLSEMTKQHVTVALSGDGGDELFAGYERFAAGVLSQRLGRLPLSPLARVLPPGKLRRFAAASSSPMPDSYRDLVSYVPEGLARELVLDDDPWSADDYRAIWASTAGAAPLDRLLRLNVATYLLDDLLPKADRASMAHALEVRAPMLDHHLAELAFRLPPELKARGRSLKRVLKAAAAPLVPAAVLDRPKTGFGVPLARWFRDDLEPFVRGTLGGPGAAVRRHLDGTVVDRVIAEHGSGRFDHGQVLWSLLMLEVFLSDRGW